MNEVAAIPTNDAASLMEIITRAAKDTTVDVSKLERLMGMYERIEAKRAESAYAEAMNAAQAEMRAISQDASNPQTRSKYASYGALDAAIRPIYSKHGFALSFDTADGAPENCVRVVCKVSHKAGHSERPHLDMPNDGKGAKGGDVMTKTHATMSAVSYARRGLLKMIWNLSEGEYDDDGNGAGGGDRISTDEADTITALMDEVKADRAKFLKFMGVADVGQIPAARYSHAVRALEAKRAKVAS